MRRRRRHSRRCGVGELAGLFCSVGRRAPPLSLPPSRRPAKLAIFMQRHEETESVASPGPPGPNGSPSSPSLSWSVLSQNMCALLCILYLLAQNGDNMRTTPQKIRGSTLSRFLSLPQFSFLRQHTKSLSRQFFPFFFKCWESLCWIPLAAKKSKTHC